MEFYWDMLSISKTVDLEKIIVIINLDQPNNVKKLCATIGHTRYYQKFIKSYAQIIVSLEKLLKKDTTFCCNDECQQSLDVLKEKMITTTILVFLDWKKEFHIHVDASCIALGTFLEQPWVGDLDHPIALASQKLSKA